MYQKVDAAVDDKWRLSLPVDFARRFTKPTVTLAVTRNHCLGIFQPNVRSVIFDGEGIRLQRRSDGYTRITIPRHLRNATSFFYGHTVTLVRSRGCVEIWPRRPGDA